MPRADRQRQRCPRLGSGPGPLSPLLSVADWYLGVPMAWPIRAMVARQQTYRAAVYSGERRCLPNRRGLVRHSWLVRRPRHVAAIPRIGVGVAISLTLDYGYRCILVSDSEILRNELDDDFLRVVKIWPDSEGDRDRFDRELPNVRLRDRVVFHYQPGCDAEPAAGAVSCQT